MTYVQYTGTTHNYFPADDDQRERIRLWPWNIRWMAFDL